MTTVTVSEFKTKCLGLIERVHETRVPLTVTKRGRQLVRVIPATDQQGPRSLKGTILFQSADIISTGEPWGESES